VSVIAVRSWSAWRLKLRRTDRHPTAVSLRRRCWKFDGRATDWSLAVRGRGKTGPGDDPRNTVELQGQVDRRAMGVCRARLRPTTAAGAAAGDDGVRNLRVAEPAARSRHMIIKFTRGKFSGDLEDCQRKGSNATEKVKARSC